jgi:hypothetical protein
VAARVDLSGSTRMGRAPVLVAILSVGFATVAALVDSSAWFVLLLAAATVGNIWLVAILASWCVRRGDRVAAFLYLAGLLIVFGLAGAAATLEQSIEVQWGEQILRTANQALFLVASLRLARLIRSRPPSTG